MCHRRTVYSVLSILAFVLVSGSLDADFKPFKSIKPLQTWSGKSRQPELKRLAPASHFIDDAVTWEKVWTAWQPEKKQPEVNFTTELVLVVMVPGPNNVIVRPMIDDAGDIKWVAGGTKVGGPGFGYKLIKVSRSGVKSVKGKSLERRGVFGELIIPKQVETFSEQSLEIKLWEYDPRLADAAATLVDEFTRKSVSHQQEKKTVLKFQLGNDQPKQADRKYYLTAFVLQNGTRTHMGERDGKSGLCKVLTEGTSETVTLIVRKVR